MLKGRTEVLLTEADNELRAITTRAGNIAEDSVGRGGQDADKRVGASSRVPRARSWPPSRRTP